MLFPALGFLLFCILLVPFALANLLLQSGKRSLGSVLRFYLGAGLWPMATSGFAKLLELENVWLNSNFELLPLLAPLGGFLFDWIWRKTRLARSTPLQFTAALLFSAMLAFLAFFDFFYMENLEYNPSFSDAELPGRYRGPAGDLVIKEGDWKQDGDFQLRLNGKSFRVVTSFAQLCLAEDFDVEAPVITYRKLSER